MNKHKKKDEKPLPPNEHRKKRKKKVLWSSLTVDQKLAIIAEKLKIVDKNGYIK